MCLGLGQGVVSAQWQDDIYYNSSDAQKEEEQRAAREQERARRQQQNTYNQSGNGYNDEGGDYVRTYDSDDYIDYDDDPSYYATNIRRFNYPFYNMGFYSAFYDPFWYNPYWVDPYWGWSWWGRPGFGMGWGMGWGGGPYWSSYWGWHTWYGYPGFYSGWGMGMGWGGGYYNGYWNGYYAGLHNGGGYGGRSVTYGPRYSTNGNYNAPRRNNPRTTAQGGGVTPQQAPVTSGSFQRRSNAELHRSGQQPARAGNLNNANLRTNTPGATRGTNPRINTGDPAAPVRSGAGQPVPNRGGAQPAAGRRQFIQQEGGTGTTPADNQHVQPMQRNTQPQQQRFSQPQRQQQSQPRMNAPQRSGGSGGSMFRGGGSTGGGSRSFGGGTGGGGRSGGSGGGGGRR